jgi:hypothetical protein
MSKQDKEFLNKFRCLRMHLAPLMSSENSAIMEEAVKRLESNGAVSTDPANHQTKKSQGKRRTKQELFNKYYYKNI